MIDRGIIYLDYHAHAPMDPRVVPVLMDAFERYDANPHSTHGPGQSAYAAVEAARVHVADLIGAEPSEVVFTSGATEANNLAITGFAHRPAGSGRGKVLVGAGEHHSVLAPAEAAIDGSASIRLDPVGTLDMDALSRLLAGGAGLVSVAAANHEIGTLQALTAIGRAAHDAGTLFHSDLAQAAGKVPVDLQEVDYASISSHKLGGPSGIGALFVRRRLRRQLRPQLLGGGQEGGLRSGTVPAPLCVAFGEACRLARLEMAEESVRVGALRDELLAKLSAVGGLQVNGGELRLPGNLNVSFEGVDGEALVMRLKDTIAVSTGSACTASSLEPSHVLLAIGLSERRAEGAIRFGLGRSTSSTDVAVAADAVVEAVTLLRATTMRRVA